MVFHFVTISIHSQKTNLPLEGRSRNLHSLKSDCNGWPSRYRKQKSWTSFSIKLHLDDFTSQLCVKYFKRHIKTNCQGNLVDPRRPNKFKIWSASYKNPFTEGPQKNPILKQVTDNGEANSIYNRKMQWAS